MGRFKVGDIVARNSYNKDIIFKIVDMEDKNGEIQYILKGTNFRIMADSFEEDLVESTEDEYNIQSQFGKKRLTDLTKDKEKLFRGEEIKNKKKNKKGNKKFGMAPRILHLDGDKEYLEICLRAYTAMGLEAYGKVIPEIEQSRVVEEYLNRIRPDILVLTGHDSVVKDCDDYRDINNYRNSKYFMEAVKKARVYEASYDQLVIFAGACQSCYEDIIKSGALLTKLR